MTRFSDPTVPSLQGEVPKLPADLPHGLLTPPQQVRELVERERARHPPASFAKAEERLVNEWTLQHYFEGLGHEVLYRPTPGGPEVLAVGFEEIRARTDDMDPEKMKGLRTWVPG
jgi:hypothetical protein